ncbi:MAG: FAD:protein FMN transferase [Verrucomicrobia bacterium]|nr:FAD:protein FMN transferase [Verrucomicrobiota bacterium]
MLLSENIGIANMLARPPVIESDGLQQVVFQAMGTQCEILFDAPSGSSARRFRDQAVGWVERFEANCSRYRPDSTVSRLNAAAGREWVALDPDTDGLFSLCDWFNWTTKRVFDPSVLPLARLWDYKHAHPTVPEPDAIERARSLVGWRKVQRRKGAAFLPTKGMAVDLGGIGKEYAVDRVMEMALNAGLQNVLVNFGHDLRVHGEPPEGGPWRIGLENPTDPSVCWTGIGVQDRAVCSSGDYLRNFTIDGKTYGHIVDPRTGYPVCNGSRSVSVIAPTCTEAGILSTSVFIMGMEEGLPFLDNYYQAEGCIWHENSVFQTRRFDKYVL